MICYDMMWDMRIRCAVFYGLDSSRAVNCRLPRIHSVNVRNLNHRISLGCTHSMRSIFQYSHNTHPNSWAIPLSLAPIHLPSPPSNSPIRAMATPEQQSAIDTLNPGDLVLVTSTESQLPLMLKVQYIDSNGTVHIWSPRFSIRQRVPRTWSISGSEVCYTGTIDECCDPASASGDNQGTLQPLATHETLHVRPDGRDALQLYWMHRCPYLRCRNHMCAGSEVAEEFPELWVRGGMAVCCPVCMGYEFACEDRELLGRLQKEVEEDVQSFEVARLVRERLSKINERRKELEYNRVAWSLRR